MFRWFPRVSAAKFLKKKLRQSAIRDDKFPATAILLTIMPKPSIKLVRLTAFCASGERFGECRAPRRSTVEAVKLLKTEPAHSGSVFGGRRAADAVKNRLNRVAKHYRKTDNTAAHSKRKIVFANPAAALNQRFPGNALTFGKRTEQANFVIWKARRKTF